MARTLAELPKGARITDYISLGVLAKTFPKGPHPRRAGRDRAYQFGPCRRPTGSGVLLGSTANC